MAGMILTSARPAFRSSAHCDGTANERSYRPARGPSVKPQTSGAVFKNSTMEMRSLPIFANARGQFTIAQHAWLPNAREGWSGEKASKAESAESSKGTIRAELPKSVSAGLHTNDASKTHQ